MYYNKQGKQISLKEWVRLARKDEDYKRVGKTILPSGKVVSTVWVGIDHGLLPDTKRTFETMVFPKQGDFSEEYCNHYATLEEAQEGHERAVKKFK